MYHPIRRFIKDDIEPPEKPRPNFDDNPFLSEKKLRFVGAWSGNLIAAAKAAGYKNAKAAAYRLMQDPEVVKALQKKQESMLQESGEQFARTIPFSRADVIDRLWQLAQLSPERTNSNITGQVKAAQALEEIFALNIDRNPGLKRQIEGKSEAELEFYVVHGFLPYKEEEQKPTLEGLTETPQLPESIVSTESTTSIAGNHTPELQPPAEIAEPASQ